MRKPKAAYSYQISLVPEREGGYSVLIPALQGCVSYGATLEEATQNAREAIELHLDNLAAHKQPIPEGQDSAPIFTTLVSIARAHV